MRLRNDSYMTPEPVCAAICERLLTRWGTSLVVEPQAGTGNFVRAIRKVQPKVPILAVERFAKSLPKLQTLADARTEVVHADFLALPRWRKYANIVMVIGNPPYASAEAHVRAALERMRPGDILAYLMRMAFLTTQARARGLYKEHPLYQLHPLAERPHFRTRAGHGESSEYGVFVWQKGFVGRGQIMPHIWWHPENTF